MKRTNRRPDGDLPGALVKLEDAIHALVEPRVEYLGRILTCPGLYDQLRAMVAGMQGTSNGHANRSMPPIWVDAVDILNDIDVALTAWRLPERATSSTRGSGTVQRVRDLRNRLWGPQDTRTVEKITSALEEWATSIDALLDPPQKLHIAAPCPRCKATTVKRTDRGGEQVNQPVLSVDPGIGCTCLHCGASWHAGQFRHLHRVIEQARAQAEAEAAKAADAELAGDAA